MPISVMTASSTTTTIVESSKVCSIDGCHEEKSVKGFCSHHYNSFRRYGDPLAASQRRTRTARTIDKPATPVKLPTIPAPVPIKCDDIRHPAFNEVIELVESSENVMLVGPAGTGKSHLAEMVATSLGRRFGSISCSAGMSESHLVGRMVPMGEQGQFQFLGTEFLTCFEEGGIFLLDEMDSADPNVLLVINSALANGRISIPARHDKPVAKRHPDFAMIAACNTYGRGADRQYVGRSQLDESTLDRFRMGTIDIDYSQAVERKLFVSIAGESRLSVLESLWKYRAGVLSSRLERCVSTRFVIAAANAVMRGRDLAYVESKLFNGWRKDEITKVKGAN